MIPSLEVGATFTVVDRASAVLRALADQFASLNKLIEKTEAALKTVGNVRFTETISRLGDINRQLGGIMEKSRAIDTAMAGGLTKFDAAVGTSITRLDQLLAKMTEVAVAGREIGAISMAGGGGRGGGGGHVRPTSIPASPSAMPHLRRNGTPLGGGFHLSGGSNFAMGAGAALAYGVYEEAEIEDVAARAMLTGQLKVDSQMTSSAAFQQLRDVVQRVSAKTGFSPKEVGEAILTTERQFGGLPFQERVGLTEMLAPFAASEARMKETTFPAAFEALVSLAHMTGTYDPKQLPELMRQFQYASMITPVPIEQFRSALSYSMPVLHAGLGMSPESVMFLTAMTQTAGITNTKSGTWIRSLFENSVPHVAGPGGVLTKSEANKNSLLESMGLITPDHKRTTWMTNGPDGKTDWTGSVLSLADKINEWSKKTPEFERLATFHKVFNERGAGEAALFNLDQFMAQLPVLREKMAAFKGGEDVLGSLTGASPVQQARNAWSDLQNVLMDIGASVLPPLVAGLGAFDAMLKQLKATTGEKGSSAIISTGIVAGLLSMTSWGRTALGGIARFLGGAAGPIGLAFGAKEMLDIADPKGSLWGLMSGVDSWFKSRFGIDPSQVPFRIGAAPGWNAANPGFHVDSFANAPNMAYNWQERNRIQSMLYRNGYAGGDSGSEAAREAKRGAALGALTVSPTVNIVAHNTFTVDGHVIASVITPYVVKAATSEFTHGPAAFDAHATYAAPDISSGGH